MDEPTLEVHLKWFKVSCVLPVPIKNWSNSVSVICCWGADRSNVAEMSYVAKTLRGKRVERFEWNGKISPWTVTHWMYLPSPPKEVTQ